MCVVFVVNVKMFVFAGIECMRCLTIGNGRINKTCNLICSCGQVQ